MGSSAASANRTTPLAGVDQSAGGAGITRLLSGGKKK